MFRTLGTVALSLALAVPASAQDNGDDWDFGQDASRGLTMAAVTFDNFGVAVRCLNQTVSVVITGVEASPGEQSIRFAMPDSPDRDTAWIGSQDGRVLFALWPAAIATELQKGGRMSLGIPGGDRIRRMNVDLPASPQAISRVFTACDRELPSQTPDQPQGEDLGGLVWRSAPQPNFPSNTAAEAGVAALLCGVDARGNLRGCRVESQFPEGGGFGRAAVLGAHRTGRVALAEGARGPLEDRTISFVVRYGLLPRDLRPPSRLPVPRAATVPPQDD